VEGAVGGRRRAVTHLWRLLACLAGKEMHGANCAGMGKPVKIGGMKIAQMGV